MEVALYSLSALAVLPLCGCGGTLSSSAVPSTGGASGLTQNIVAAPVLGYAWDSSAQVLREIDGVPGAAQVVATAGTGSGFAAATAARSQAYALLLDGKGALYLTMLPGGTPRLLAAGPWTSAAISASGEFATVYSAAGAAPTVMSGLPLAPVLHSVDAQGLGITAAAVSDDGTALLAAKSSGTGATVLAVAPGGSAASHVMTAGGVGGMAFVPGSDRALVADASSGTVTQLDHVNSGATPSLLSGVKISNPLGLDISADGRWALMANSAGTVMRLDLSGQSAPVSGKCSCTPVTVANLSGSAFRLTGAGTSTGWMVEAGGAGPRVLFIPALPGQKATGGGQ